ncbi:MAG: hypothetical protein WD250_09555 [Egibacteraceae bacterium]
MEVHESARKHGVADVDIAHAITHHLYAGVADDDQGPPWRVLYLGPDRAANLLEVVVVERDDGSELAIHVMRMRRRYEALLPFGRGRHHE